MLKVGLAPALLVLFYVKTLKNVSILCEGFQPAEVLLVSGSFPASESNDCKRSFGCLAVPSMSGEVLFNHTSKVKVNSGVFMGLGIFIENDL